MVAAEGNGQGQSGLARSATVDVAMSSVPTGQPLRIDPAWRRTALILAAGVVALIALYWPAAEAAVNVWYGSTAYNHCFLIPFITGYLLWERRAVLAPLHPEPTLWPLPVMLGIGAVALLGNVMTIMEVQHFALVAMILVFALMVVGWTVFRAMLFPMLYLFFMVPSGDFLVPKLQDFTAKFVVLGLQLVGVPVLSDGVFIKIPNGLFEVAEACAGLRFLIASVAFGFLFSYLMYRTWQKRAVFVILSFIIPIIANGFRAFGIVIIAHATDGRVAAGVDHIVYGWGFFVAIMLTMMWVGLKYRDDDQPLPAIGSSSLFRAHRSYPAVGVALAAVVVAAAAPAYGYWLDHRPVGHHITLAAPKAEAPWRISPDARDGWRPEFAGADGELREAYRGPNGSVQLYIAYFTSQRHGAKIVSAQNRLDDETTWRRASSGSATATVDGQSMTVAKQTLTLGVDRRIAWYLYWVDGQLTASAMRAKLLGARGTLLTGTPQAAAIVVATDVTSNEEEAERRLQDFLTHLEPVAPLLRQAALR
jgi:exosortase A